MCGTELKQLLESLTPVDPTVIEALENGAGDVLLLACVPDGAVSLSLAEIKRCTIQAYCEGLKEYKNCEDAEADGIEEGDCWKTALGNTFGLPAGVIISQPASF